MPLARTRDYTSSTLDLYEFRMSLFDHGNPEEFLLFVWNLETDTKVQYLCRLVCGEALHHLDLMYAYVVNKKDTSLTVDYPLKSLAWYLFTVNYLF